MKYLDNDCEIHNETANKQYNHCACLSLEFNQAPTALLIS